MILTLHIIIAVASLILGGLALSRTDQVMLRGQIASFGLTVLSGVALAVQHPAALTHLCISGVIFSGISIGLIVVARQRIAAIALT